MFNMATMAADECRIDAEERAYYRWIDKASQLLGHQVALGSQEESDLHDFYADGCAPAEAVTELLAQAELDSASECDLSTVTQRESNGRQTSCRSLPDAVFTDLKRITFGLMQVKAHHNKD